jgi:hypothetical protein
MVHTAYGPANSIDLRRRTGHDDRVGARLREDSRADMLLLKLRCSGRSIDVLKRDDFS